MIPSSGLTLMLWLLEQCITPIVHYCGFDFGLGLFYGVNDGPIRDARFPGHRLHVASLHEQVQQFLVIGERSVLGPRGL